MTVLNTGSCKAPQVSIGMPVYNGEATVRKAIDSILAQTFTDFELIISDNASTDGTEAICRKFAEQDARIKYFRQAGNTGAGANFEFVLRCSVGEYFMWAAADDRRSAGFLEINVSFLQSNPALSASTSPNCWEGEESDAIKHVNFSLNGDYPERCLKFLKNSWISHGIFYSLMRAEVIKSYQFPEIAHTAHDWIINLYILSKGEINRATNGLTIIGKNGVSNQGNPWKTFRKRRIEAVLPLYEFTRYALSVSAKFSLREKITILLKLMKLNFTATMSNLTLTLKNQSRT